MVHQDAPIEFHPFSLAHGDRSLSLCALKWSDGNPSPGTKGWSTDSSGFSQRASSKSPSLSSVPSTCSTEDFPPTPPSNPSLRLPQLPVVPSIRHRTPQACDKCRERKTKCSGHHPTCLRCNSRGLTCKYSARETRIRGSLKSRTLVQTFDDRPLFNEGRCGFPTPAHHSRMGSCQTSAFIRSLDGNDALKVPPVYTTAPVAGRRFDWQLEDLVPPSLPIPTRPRSLLDSNSNRTRKPLHIRPTLLDTSGHSYDRIPPTDSFSVNREFNSDYPRLTPRIGADYLPLSKEGQELVSNTISGCIGDRAFQPLMPEGRSVFDFNEELLSLVDTENFPAAGFPSFATPYHLFDTHFVNGPGIFC